MSAQPTIDDRQQVIADLKAARQELVTRGRNVGQRVAHDGRVCALGAIAVAVVEDFSQLYLNNAKDVYGYRWCTELRNPRIAAAEAALIPHVPNPVYGSWNHSISAFNDRVDTTDADVLNLFEKALAELGGLA